MNTSYIIITFNREKLLENCLYSLVKQVSNGDQIIVVINGKELKKNELEKKYPGICFYQINSTTPAAARNYATQFTTNDWLCFLDDDTFLPTGYITKAKSIIHQYNPDVYGGPDQIPPNSSFFENALSLALRSPLTTAHTRYRHKTTKKLRAGSESNLILCHLWIKKNTLLAEMFNPNLKRNEENVLLDKLIAKGKNILYIPELWIYHHRKKDFYSLFCAVSTSGYFRARTFGANPQLSKIVYFVPLFFSFYLFLIAIYPDTYFLIPLAVYCFLNLVTSVREVYAVKRLDLLVPTALIQFCIVVFYGFGFLKGLLAIATFLLRGRGLSLDRA